ncbi:MAG: Arylsulfatase [Verrucomicrobia subdivision 3 bacterium]|nr:Arylsulfatase [Limisphaerales bacterium]MCS1417037.1 Arylsulfatase [Limisphaerales bacterium]
MAERVAGERFRAGWVALLGALSLAAADRPNILFIMADDHTSQAWSCYGGRLAAFAKTPNIDRLAAEGALLENCFCVNSICVPSRASILTGQYSHRNGVRTLRDALPSSADNVAKRLQAVGYQTALVGKWHLKQAPAGFHYWNIIKGQGRYHEPVMYEMSLDNGEVQTGAYSTDVFTDKALNWLDRCEPSKPFCLMLHFKATHEPWQFHPRHAALFEDVEIPEPDTLLRTTGPKDSRVPGWPLEILTGRMTAAGKHGNGKLIPSSDDPVTTRQETYQKFVKDFLRCGAAIDENVGRVMDYLRERRLTNSTVLIYTSDQGYFLGEHNYFDKRFMLEESLRMPFVIRYPKEIRARTVLDDLVLNIDFAATFLDYAGVTIPGSLQGRSFRTNLRGQTPLDWRDAMYYRYFENSESRPAHFGIRTQTRKLIYYDGLRGVADAKRWEFYDLAEDPHENENRYDAMWQSEIVRDLKKRLAVLQAQAGDSP